MYKNFMRVVYDLTSIIERSSDKSEVRSLLGDSTFFNPHILSYHDEALRVWRDIARRYSDKEGGLNIPYRLAESAKLYAVDALCVAEPLIAKKADLRAIAQFFGVFYLIVHYFDDHVEHRDKFYSKFDFSPSHNIDTQRGAAPFSFTLVSLSILHDILKEISSLNAEQREQILENVNTALALQTRYFAAERQSNLDIDEVLEMKQRQVSGKTLSTLGGIIGLYLNFDAKQARHFSEGLTYLGSLTQITDDIRDLSIDAALRNANIVAACHRLGSRAGNTRLERIYDNEVALTINHLKHIYSEDNLSVLLSLPFYPFMVNKQELEREA